jgi:alkylated DNA repair dioxygenase AlkB
VSAAQGQLFGSATPLPEGFTYVEEFISLAEERTLLAAMAALPLEEARYKDYTARRRIALFEEGMPEFLLPLRDRIAAWLGVPAAALRHALVNEYRPGTPLGWHRDAPAYERVAGVSLGTPARMRLRPYPPAKAQVLNLQLAPRSAYRMQGPARWSWQHSIPATKALRYSITFRTLRLRSAPRGR